MNRPVCKKDRLRPKTLENNLPAYQCTACGEVWLSSEKYYHWLRDQPETPEIKGVPEPMPVAESEHARISPESNGILRRYKVWPNQDFYIDRDERTQSIWLDKGEWEYLVARNLHDDIHLFFMPQWQEKLRDEESRQRFEEIYRKRYGDADYERIKEIREWIYAHPQSNTLLAFLLDKDPYKAS
jgi:Zn-finger nucleic acid-binding protein